MIDQPTRFVSIPHSAGAVEFEDLTVSFIVDETLDNWLEIYNWMRSASNTKDFKEYEDSKEHYVDATLTVLNSSMTPQIRVEYENIIPTSLSALEFDSTVSTPEALIASATFKYTTYEITKLS
jgi:7-cyano-7-deazaguanine synthase in queuosine biosynthesis